MPELIGKMDEELKKIKLGEHYCCIYRNKEEQFSIVIPFILIGLENGEKCIYIVDENTKEDVIVAFQKSNADIKKYIKTRQLEFFTKEDTYLKDGYFDPDRMIQLLKQTQEKALKERYGRLRVTGEMTWVFTKLPGVEKLIEYEAKLNFFFPESKSVAICQYNETKFKPEVLIDVIHVHPKVIIYDSICDNSYYIPPDEFIARMKGEISVKLYERIRDAVIERMKREKERMKTQDELKQKIDALERFQKVAVGRELKMKELKAKIAELETKLGGRS